jgi:hypothetical protein
MVTAAAGLAASGEGVTRAIGPSPKAGRPAVVGPVDRLGDDPGRAD